jgi:glycosyltransferase 2 family protein
MVHSVSAPAHLTRRSAIGLLGVAISLLCFWLAFRGVPLGELVSAFAGANYWWILPATAAQLLGSLARARRWQVLLLNQVSFADAFWALMIGLLGNNVLPLRAGEAARVVVVSQRTGLPLAQVAGSVVLERALDVATILGLLLLLLPLMQVPPAAMAAAIALGAGLALAAVLVLILLAAPERCESVLRTVSRRLPDRVGQLILRQWQELSAGFATLRDRRTVGRIVWWSVLSWAGTVGMCWAIIEAVAPGASAIEPTFTTVAISLGIALPSSPGYIGVFQLVAQQALLLPFPSRYTASSALSVAILVHALYYVFTTSLGAVGLARLGLSLARVRPQYNSQ